MKAVVKFFRKVIPDTHPVRLLYHKITAVIAALVYRFPANDLIVIGITGTKGKTTTTNLIANILTSSGFKVGMTSTAGFQIADKKWVNDTKQTTLSPFKMQKLLRRMVNEGCKYAVLEISSHAVVQSRTFGISLDVGLVTNVVSEHVEYHGGFNNYLAAKGKLLEKVSKDKRKFGVPKVIILNNDDRYYNFFNQFIADRKMVYGLRSGTIYADQIQKGHDGSSFILKVPNNAIPIFLKLPGDFNIYNALAASAVCISLQISLEDIKKGLEDSSIVSGRFEHVDAGQKYGVIVDYAHTAESLESLLSLYKGLTAGKLFAVFGATGGGRDKAKRKKMGEAAQKFADYIILTDDDPYEDDEWEIIDMIAEGVPRQEGNNFWKIPDRREAIRLALTLAKEGDTVVVAGKGSEEVMMLKGKRIPWNDRRVILDLLTREIEVEIAQNNFEKRENVCKENWSSQVVTKSN